MDATAGETAHIFEEKFVATMSIEARVIRPRDLDGVAALIAAGETAMCKRKGERDTEFVKRIVAAYMNAHAALHPQVRAI